MMETKESLLEGLNYVRSMTVQMQSVLEEYIKLERAFRSKQAQISTSGVKDRSKLMILTVLATVLVFNLFIYMLTRDSNTLLSMVIAVAAGLFFWKKRRQKSKLKWIALLFVVFYFYTIFESLFRFMTPFIAVILMLFMALVIAAEYFFITGKNKKIAAHNREVEDHNASVQAQRTALYNRYKELQTELNRNTPSWFPPDYYNMEAIDFFINVVRNNRADSVKEMVNLFESTAQHQEMISYQRQQTQQLNQLVNGQQAIQKELRFANMMNVASFIQAAAIGKDVKRAADAAGRTASSMGQVAMDVQKIRKKIQE